MQSRQVAPQVANGRDHLPTQATLGEAIVKLPVVVKRLLVREPLPTLEALMDA